MGVACAERGIRCGVLVGRGVLGRGTRYAYEVVVSEDVGVGCGLEFVSDLFLGSFGSLL